MKSAKQIVSEKVKNSKRLLEIEQMINETGERDTFIDYEMKDRDYVLTLNERQHLVNLGFSITDGHYKDQVNVYRIRWCNDLCVLNDNKKVMIFANEWDRKQDKED